LLASGGGSRLVLAICQKKGFAISIITERGMFVVTSLHLLTTSAVKRKSYG
jgi:hypothetical protein